jgi:hypothetical protein
MYTGRALPLQLCATGMAWISAFRGKKQNVSITSRSSDFSGRDTLKICIALKQ